MILRTLIALLVLTLPFRADAADRKRPTPAQTEARREYERGAQLYRSGQYEEAIDAFRKAYAAQPHPALLFNIGQAQEKLGQLEGALESYRGYLQAAPDAQDRGAVQTAIASLEERIAASKIQSLRVRSLPEQAQVSIDGASRGVTPLELRLPVGEHQVELTLEGYEAAKRQVSLTSTAAVELDVTLVKKAPPPPPSRTWTWVALGTGAALAAGGAAVGFFAQQDADNLRNFQHDQAQADALHDGAQTKALTANILYGAAGAAVVAGGALFFIEGQF